MTPKLKTWRLSANSISSSLSRAVVFACIQVLLGICFAVVPSALLAYKPSDSYLEINSSDTFNVQWDIALRDLEILIGLDSNIDGQITWGEVKEQQQEIFDQAISHLKISLDDIDLSLVPAGLEVTEHTDGAYAVLKFSSDAPRRFTLMKINYDFFFEVDNTHRSLVSYNGNFGSGSYVVGAVDETLIVPEGGTHWFYLTMTYIRVGSRHIWVNYDHLIFLIALVLPSVWRFEEDKLKYVPAEKFKPAFFDLFLIVTCVTIAQGITLWNAMYDSANQPSHNQPSHWISTMMAVLIVLSAMHNMYPMIRYWVLIVAMAFGLTLGFGFGNFLAAEGLPSSMLPVALLGFSIGVELAQVAFVTVLFLVAFVIRKTNFYDQFIFHGGSTLIVILGTIWVIESLGGATILRVPEMIQEFF